MYTLIGKCMKQGLLIDLQLELVDRMIVPIILEEFSMVEVWENQTFGTVNMLKYNINKNLKCQCITKC